MKADDRTDRSELLLGLLPDEEEPVRRKPLPVPTPKPVEPPQAGGPDGKDVEASVGDYLDYLSQLCRQLGVPDPVEEYFAPVVGRWSAMHEEADRWRKAGKAADEVSDLLTKPLGGLDAAWEGETADSFIAYMQKVGLAGNDMSDAMNSMGEVLDKTADGIREIVTELAGVLADTAEASSQAMANPVAGEERTRQHLDAVRRPTREFFESVRQVLEAFVKLCDGIDGSKAFDQVKMAHTVPAENWSADIDVPTPPPAPAPGPPPEATTQEAGAKSGGGKPAGGVGGGGGGGGSVAGGGAATPSPTPTPAKPELGQGAYTAVGEVPGSPATSSGAAAALGGVAAAGGGAGGMGGGMMMPPMMGAGMGGAESQEHNSKSRVIGNPEDIFGEPTEASPSVIGEED
jgi:uncharacterized protein YukE